MKNLFKCLFKPKDTLLYEEPGKYRLYWSEKNKEHYVSLINHDGNDLEIYRESIYKLEQLLSK